MALASVGVLARAQTDTLASLHVPERVVGGKSSGGNVALTAAATASDSVALSSSSTDVTPAASVTIAKGHHDTDFAFTTNAVTSEEPVTLTATLGTSTATGTLNLLPAGPSLVGLSLYSNSVVGGQNDWGRATLSGRAENSVTVALSSSSSAASVPASVTISGEDGRTFEITTTGVDTSTTATITATLGSASFSQTLTVGPASLREFNATKTVRSGSSGTATIHLKGQAGPSGVSVSLSSNNTDLTIASAGVVAAGSDSVQVPFRVSSTAPAEEIVLTATLGGTTLNATVKVVPVTLDGLDVFPGHLSGGASVVVMVWLNGFAAVPGAPVTLTSDTPGVLSLPMFATVPAGNYGGFVTATTSPVTTATTVVITATFGGVTKSYAITVYPGGPAIVP